MSSPFAFFLKRLFVFSALIAIVSFAWNQYAPEKFHSRFIWELFALFNAVTIVSHLFVLKAFNKPGNYFVKTFMAVSVVRMFLLIGIILLMVIFFRPIAVNFTVTLLPFYILYTAFEVVMLLKQNKENEN